MISFDQSRPHRLTYGIALAMCPPGALRDGLQVAMHRYISAKNSFDLVNSDDTLIALIGAYARFNRVVLQIDDKYGGK